MLRVIHSLPVTISPRRLRLEHLEHREMLCHPGNAAPVITLQATPGSNDAWMFQGTVTDQDDPVAGLNVEFGGVLADYGLSATVNADGSYLVCCEIPELVEGTATAQTCDIHGLASNLAMAFVVNPNTALPETATPTISDLEVINVSGDKWNFRGRVTGDDHGVGGMHVAFGGVLAKYHLTTIVQMDGTFSLTKKLGDLSDGAVTAQINDVPGHPSNLAADMVVTNDAAPVISDFKVVNIASNQWTFSGKVADADDNVAGRKVVFGGDLAQYQLTAIVRKDGSFSLTKRLPGLLDGTATAQTEDVHGKASDLATNVLLSTDAPPIITDFKALHVKGDTWTFSGKVADADDKVAGRKVVLGGVLAGYNLTATSRKDGTFSITKKLPGLLEGEATAKTRDLQGRFSELAVDWILALDPGV